MQKFNSFSHTVTLAEAIDRLYDLDIGTTPRLLKTNHAGLNIWVGSSAGLSQ